MNKIFKEKILNSKFLSYYRTIGIFDTFCKKYDK